MALSLLMLYVDLHVMAVTRLRGIIAEISEN
jgi:hypothetical protein